MTRIAFVLLVLFAWLTPVVAHNGVEHVRGTVTELNGTSITVAMTTKQTKTITLLADTTFVKNGVAASMKDLKVGDKVIIDAVVRGGGMAAKSVRFGASPAGTAIPTHK